MKQSESLSNPTSDWTVELAKMKVPGTSLKTLHSPSPQNRSLNDAAEANVDFNVTSCLEANYLISTMFENSRRARRSMATVAVPFWLGRDGSHWVTDVAQMGCVLFLYQRTMRAWNMLNSSQISLVFGCTRARFLRSIKLDLINKPLST